VVKVICRKGRFSRFARWHQCAPHATHCSLGPPQSTPQTASRSV